MDFLLFESEIILGKEIRDFFQPIEEVCYILRDSIEEYTEDYNQKDGRVGDAEERNRYRELRQIIYSRKGDAIQTKVDSAVREIDYQNKDLEVGLYYNGAGITSGTYRVEVYMDGYMIGTTEAYLK